MRRSTSAFSASRSSASTPRNKLARHEFLGPVLDAELERSSMAKSFRYKPATISIRCRARSRTCSSNGSRFLRTEWQPSVGHARIVALRSRSNRGGHRGALTLVAPSPGARASGPSDNWPAGLHSRAPRAPLQERQRLLIEFLDGVVDRCVRGVFEDHEL